MLKQFSIRLGLTAGLALPVLLASTGNALAGVSAPDPAADLMLLGKYVFFDKISDPNEGKGTSSASRMGCVSCHVPETGGTGGVSGVNLHQVAITGANPHEVGGLKPPTNIYASFIAPFHECNLSGVRVDGKQYCGGNFWNGRAEGNLGDTETPIFTAGPGHIGAEVFAGGLTTSCWGREDTYRQFFGPTSDQALGPMPNDAEHNIDRQEVCNHVASQKYAAVYELAWCEEIKCGTPAEVDLSFKRLMLAVGAWQHSADLNSFSSKRDIALRQELACVCDANAADPRCDQSVKDLVTLQGNDTDGSTLTFPPAVGLYLPDDSIKVAKLVEPYLDPAVCSQADYTGSPGTFPLAGLTALENRGHDIFYNTPPRPFAAVNNDTAAGRNYNPLPRTDLPKGNCSFCHSDNPGTWNRDAQAWTYPPHDGTELFQLYADDAYHAIGIPFNPELPADPDPGLLGHAYPAADPNQEPDSSRGLGGFKAPTVRNVDKRKGNGFTKAYGHNGWFKSLESIVHFYNSGFVDGATAQALGIERCPAGIETEKDALANNCWPEQEWPAVTPPVPNANLIGNLGMTPEDEAAVVAYLKALTDLETPQAPSPYTPPKAGKKK